MWSLMPRILVLCGIFFLAACLRKAEMKLVYGQRCLSCHGPSGRGEGGQYNRPRFPVPGEALQKSQALV